MAFNLGAYIIRALTGAGQQPDDPYAGMAGALPGLAGGAITSGPLGQIPGSLVATPDAAPPPPSLVAQPPFLAQTDPLVAPDPGAFGAVPLPETPRLDPTLAAPPPVAAPPTAQAPPVGQRRGFMGLQWNPDLTPNQRWLAVGSALQDLGDIGLGERGGHLDALLHGDAERHIPGVYAENTAARLKAYRAGTVDQMFPIPADANPQTVAAINRAKFAYLMGLDKDDPLAASAFKIYEPANVGPGEVRTGTAQGAIGVPSVHFGNDQFVGYHPDTDTFVAGPTVAPKAQTPLEVEKTKTEIANLQSQMEERGKAHQEMRGLTADGYPIWHDTTGQHPDEIGNTKFHALPSEALATFEGKVKIGMDAGMSRQRAMDWANGSGYMSPEEVEVAASKQAAYDVQAGMYEGAQAPTMRNYYRGRFSGQQTPTPSAAPAAAAAAGVPAPAAAPPAAAAPATAADKARWRAQAAKHIKENPAKRDAIIARLVALGGDASGL